jgi:hypothetical protein
MFGRCPARAQSTLKEDFLHYRDELAGHNGTRSDPPCYE